MKYTSVFFIVICCGRDILWLYSQDDRRNKYPCFIYDKMFIFLGLVIFIQCSCGGCDVATALCLSSACFYKMCFFQNSIGNIKYKFSDCQHNPKDPSFYPSSFYVCLPNPACQHLKYFQAYRIYPPSKGIGIRECQLDNTY